MLDLNDMPERMNMTAAKKAEHCFDTLPAKEGSRPAVVTYQFFPPSPEVTNGESVARHASFVGSEFFRLPEMQVKKAVDGAPLQVKKSRRGPPSRSSQYRGVTFYRRTGRWESHIWDSGKQVYLGGFDTAVAAARAYDKAAIRFRGVNADINFSLEEHEEELKLMSNLTKEEFVCVLRRSGNTGFPKGTSKLQGATLHGYGGWTAKKGQFLNKRYAYLGILGTEMEAARNFNPFIYDDEFKLTTGYTDYSLDLSLGSLGSKRSNSRKTESSTPPNGLQAGQKFRDPNRSTKINEDFLTRSSGEERTGSLCSASMVNNEQQQSRESSWNIFSCSPTQMVMLVKHHHDSSQEPLSCTSVIT